MIKVNLYPQARTKVARKAKEATPLRGFLMLLAGITVAAAVVVAGAVFFLKMNVADLRAQIDENRKTLTAYQQKSEEVRRYERLNAEYTRKSGVIETLRSNQSVPVRMLSELSARLPQGVWLHGVMHKGDSISIEGYAFSNNEIVGYVENLRQAPVFSEVSLQETRESEYHQTTLYKFMMSVKIKA